MGIQHALECLEPVHHAQDRRGRDGESNLSILLSCWFPSSVCNPESMLALATCWGRRRPPLTLRDPRLTRDKQLSYPSIRSTKWRLLPCRGGWSTTHTCLLMETMSKLYPKKIAQTCINLKTLLAQGKYCCGYMDKVYVKMGRHLKARDKIYNHNVLCTVHRFAPSVWSMFRFIKHTIGI